MVCRGPVFEPHLAHVRVSGCPLQVEALRRATVLGAFYKDSLPRTRRLGLHWPLLQYWTKRKFALLFNYAVYYDFDFWCRGGGTCKFR
jgi:hypothetical protein